VIAPALLSVCATCRKAGDMAEIREGARLFDLVEGVFRASGIEQAAIQPVACMSGCNRACTIGLAAPGKPSYLFGDLSADSEVAQQIVQMLRHYAGSETGHLARGERPPLLRSGILARIPSAVMGPAASPLSE
jgi:predicted metal-binding protein